MPGENGGARASSSSGGVSIGYAAGLAVALLGVGATISAGVARYTGWEAAKDAIAPEIESFDAKVNAARIESEQRRQEIREEFTERRRELEARLRVELDRISQINAEYHADMQKVVETKADEERQREESGSDPGGDRPHPGSTRAHRGPGLRPPRRGAVSSSLQTQNLK